MPDTIDIQGMGGLDYAEPVTSAPQIPAGGLTAGLAAQVNHVINIVTSVTMADVRPPVASDLAREFEALANEWHAATDHLSIVWQKAMHPAYQQIIGMGQRIVPHILEELESRGGWWFWALESITRENPAKDSTGRADAIQKWREWSQGRRLA
jgi:hypothetical protein